MKKLLCCLFALIITLSFTSCNSSEKPDGNNNLNSTQTPSNSSFKQGNPQPVGDVFELPSVKQATGAPIVSELTKQAYPGDSIMVLGEGFKDANVKFYLYSQTTKDNAKATEAKFTVVDDNYASVLIDEGLEYGIYGIYAENASGTSDIKIINKPVIWNIGLYKLTAGETLTILGENLTTKNGDKTSAFLVSEDSKEYVEVSVAFADPGKVEIVIPGNLKPENKYKVVIHNGHGGQQGFATSENSIEYLEKSAVQFNGRVLNVVDYGADPKSLGNDDSEAVNKLLKDLKDGDTIYFPAGSYLLASKITISKSVRILGAGADKTKVFAGYDISGGTLDIKKGPCEITGIRFEQKRTTGKLKGYFVNYSYTSNETGEYGLYFHANAVIQSVTAKSRSSNWPIYVTSAYGIIVEDNYFNATGMLYVAGAKKIYLRNNTAIMNVYCGTYYQICNALFTNVEFLDVSGNNITGGGAPESGPGELLDDDFTAGRVFGVQGWAHNTYISHNNVRRSGIPNFGAGEIILYENVGYRFDGMVETSTANSTTLGEGEKKNPVVKGNVVTIISGKGRGQFRKITNVSKQTLEFDRPWDIVPDSTSHVLINHGYLNAFVCYNDLDGYTNWQDQPGSTMGLQAYGTIHNMYYNFNAIKNACYGIDITPFYYNNATSGQESDARCVIAWSQFDRNYLENVGRGIAMVISTSADNVNAAIPGEIAFGNVIRKNSAKDVLDFTTDAKKGSGGLGIRMGQPNSKWFGDWCVANLFEANDLSNCATADIAFYNNQANNLFRNNTNGNNQAEMLITQTKLGPIEIKY